jgi:hypothetical protein
LSGAVNQVSKNYRQAGWRIHLSRIELLAKRGIILAMQLSSIEDGNGPEKSPAVPEPPDQRPILLPFRSSNWQPFAIPQAFVEHPLLANQYFWTVPERLLTLVLEAVSKAVAS